MDGVGYVFSYPHQASLGGLWRRLGRKLFGARAAGGCAGESRVAGHGLRTLGLGGDDFRWATKKQPSYNWLFKRDIVSACRGLMELGGRLIECLPSFFLKCRNLCFLPMDSWAAFSLGGFVAGWLARDWSLRAPEIPICRCDTDQSLVSGNSLLILLGVIGLVIALSNTAL